MEIKETNNNTELLFADELAEKGNMAFLSYTWKLNKSHDDSFESSEANPYSDDDWANDVSYPEHDLELAFDYYQQALAKYQTILEPDDIKIGETLFNCGRVSMDPMYDHVIALDFFKRALPIYLKKKHYSRDLAILYENLGSVCFSMNDLLSSLDYYHKSLSLFNKLEICGEEEDISELKEKIVKADSRLGLHIVHEGNKCGFADKDDNIVIPCIWSDVQEFSEGLCGVKDDKGLCGFVNYHGDLVIPCVYKDAYSFKNGMAYVEESVDDYFPHTFYIEADGNVVASDINLRTNQIEAIYKSSVLARFGKHAEAAECILSATASIDPEPTRMLIQYYMKSNQYDKVIEWCNKVDRIEGHFCNILSWVRNILGQCYENGLGVERDLIKAFCWYDMSCCVNDVSGEYLKERDDFLKRHPEMLELPEVQSTLEPFDDEEDY